MNSISMRRDGHAWWLGLNRPEKHNALELTKLALRSQRPATTTFDIAAQALLFGSDDKHQRMTAFLSGGPDDPRAAKLQRGPLARRSGLAATVA